ncbi:hypothetical protein DAMA08_039320 [Martiniozyma asiatica (nom. inval.)]|nr:hypothetical protein DAMA08_039320 [Martiniozyma asiatica]
MESLAAAISDTLSVFDIQNDIDMIDSVLTKLRSLDSHHSKEKSSINDRLVALRKQLKSLDESIKSLRLSSSSKSTKLTLVQLENEIFESAKSLTSLNMEINTAKITYNEDLKRLDELEQVLNKLNNSLTLLPQSDKPQDAHNADERAKMVKLKLFESIGLKFNLDKGEVLILNKNENQVKSFTIDKNYSEYFISNYIWDNL